MRPSKSSGDRIEREADERPAVIEQEKLDQERRAADDLDTQPKADTASQRLPIAPPDGDEEAEDRGADHADDPHQQGYAECARKFRAGCWRSDLVSKFIAAPSETSVRTARRRRRSAS